MPSDQFLFNGHNLSDLVMCRMERPIMPPVEVKSEQVGARHGELFRSARLRSYTVPVKVWLRSEDRRRVADIRHALAAMLWTEEPAPLYLPDDPCRYHLAIVSDATDLGAITDELPSTTIDFMVCDPVAFGSKREQALASGTSVEVKAGGTWKSWPVVTITPSSTSSVKLLNVTTGEAVEITSATYGGSIPSKQIVLDFEGQRATVNGATCGVTLASRYFALDGTQTVKLTGGTGTMEWRERWL